MKTQHYKQKKNRVLLTGVAIAVAMGLQPATAQANNSGWLGQGWEVSGYIRQHLSFNLDNPTLMGLDGEQKGDYRYDLSMSRTILNVGLYRDFGDVRFKMTGRISREQSTDYMKDLQSVMDGWATTGGAPASEVNLRKDVYNEEDIRELWVEGSFAENWEYKVGRQQIVWGETDFFTLLDVIHGYEFRWRSFLEPENEELRKPLNMVSLVRRFDDQNASLQLVYVPGRFNDNQYRGNSYDVEGGRWANNPNKGITFASAPFGANVRYNYRHPDADLRDDSFGLRWSGIAGDWGYSLAYFHGPNQNPVANANPATNPGEPQLQTGPYKGVYQGGATEAGEFIYPYVDVLGFTANNYFPGIDAVFSTEVAYIPNSPYNVGLFSIAEGPGCGFFPGFCGIAEKSVLSTMVRMDKQVNLQNVLGTSRPSFLSVQLFNTWITDFKADEQLVNLAGFGGATREYSTILTGILAMNYSNDRINPTLAVGYDLTYGGGFIIPSIEYAYGNNIRIRLEADLFFHKRDQNLPLQGFNRTNLFGYFSGNDQLVARLTYQF